MLKETEETVVFFVTFLSLVAFQLGGGQAPAPPGYAYASSKIPATNIAPNPNFCKNIVFLLYCFVTEKIN